MAMSVWLLSLLLIFEASEEIQTCENSYEMDRSSITSRIVRRSDLDTIPMANDQPVDVQVGFHLLNILHADVAQNEVNILLWMTQSWMDRSLSFQTDCSPDSYNRYYTSFDQVTVPAEKIWTPDVTFYKSVAAPEVSSPGQAVVYKDGNVTYVTQTRVRIPCHIQPDKPASVCSLRAGSWTHPSQEITLSVQGEEADLSEYVESSKF
ncbi:hypothetical protein Btru_032707 [Bulinus truncatus]|nr:hypothetical protein Btru_032707 [Bulinus truncatus]